MTISKIYFIFHPWTRIIDNVQMYNFNTYKYKYMMYKFSFVDSMVETLIDRSVCSVCVSVLPLQHPRSPRLFQSPSKSAGTSALFLFQIQIFS